MAGGTDKPPLHTRLLQKLRGDISTDSSSCSIFKVPNHLRQISEKAYEPQVISIGPYHHGKGQLMAMEVHKMFYLKMLLERIPEISLERYVTALKSMEEKARKFYSEPLNHIGGEKFVEMMLLDGCFIIELIRKSAMKKLRLKNDHLLTHFILTRVMRDLLLVENQLPFFILSELFGMTVMSNDKAKDLMDMAINFFSRMMPEYQIGTPTNQDIKHLLGLLHDSWQAPSPDCQEVRISCSILEKARSLYPKAKLNRCSSEVVRSSPPEPSEDVRFSLPKAMDISHSSLSNLSEEGQIMQIQPPMAESFASFSPPQSSKEVMAAPIVGSSPLKSSEEVKSPPSDSDNLLSPAETAPSTSFLPTKASEEPRFPPPKAMAIPCSSPPHSSEEILVGAAPLIATERDCQSASGPKRNEWQFIRSATELSLAGINFKKTKSRLFDIKFEKGVMSIPTLNINNDTESILRNLVAYEQYFNGASSKCFTNYIIFMDCLINTGKDVELLCLHGVINNCLGDHEVVAAIFNKLGEFVLISEADFSYVETFYKVNRHCNRKWNRWKAKWNAKWNPWMEYLWQNYFNNPWALISFLAAVFLLLLTVLQSVYAVLSYQFK